MLEIGPGQGALTRILAERGRGEGGRGSARVVAIEKDRELAALVGSTLTEVRVITGDALELDWHSVAWAQPGEALFVVGNIPYNITSPLVAKALAPPRPERIVFLMQDEVADRISAPPGVAAYGALSVGVQAVARVEKLFRVPAGAFHPKPKVDSAAVRLTPLERPAIEDALTDSFRRFVVGLFGLRRKQLGRGLRELTGLPQERVIRLLTDMGIDPTLRPERLTPGEFVRLHRGLIDAGGRAE